MTSNYSNNSSLGPHDYEPAQPISSRVKAAERAFKAPHQVPTALILIALLSFGANFAFGYLDFVKKDAGFEVVAENFAEHRSPLEHLGSDDVPEDPPTFASSTHFATIERPASLKMGALSYLVADADTGEIILEKDSDTPYPIASVSKLMTAIVAKENMDLHRMATVTDSSYNTYGAQGELSRGEKILIADLFYPLLIESSNDAAEVLADDFGRNNFVALLNQRASSLGMDNTRYYDPSGLSPDNVSTSHDLTRLALYIRKEYPELLDITRVKEYSILNHSWSNANYFLTYPNFLGGKNGFINEARKTTVSYFKVFFRGADPQSKAIERPLIIVILKSDDRNRDVAALLAYIGKNIRYVPDPVIE